MGVVRATEAVPDLPWKHPERVSGAEGALTFGRATSHAAGFWEEGFPKLSEPTRLCAYTLSDTF